MQEAGSHGYKVCVVDAAVLVMAGWHRRVHQIWTTLAPRTEVRLQWVWLRERIHCNILLIPFLTVTQRLLPIKLVLEPLNNL